MDDYFPIAQAYYQQMSPQDAERVSVVRLTNGTCQSCQTYAQNYDADILFAEKSLFIKDITEKSPALLALSGGKDSLTALYILREILQVPTHAFLYQNGFVPEFIVEKARAYCEQYQVKLTVVEHPLYDAFKQEYRVNEQGTITAKTGLDFCQICSVQIKRVSFQLSDELGAKWVVMGNKVYTRLHPYVSSIMKGELNGKLRQTINLLYTVGLTHAQQKYILNAMGWTDPGLAGYTSNCYIPGLVENARQQRLKMHSDQGYIEKELRSGAYTEAEALHLMRLEPVNDHILWQNLPLELKQKLRVQNHP